MRSNYRTKTKSELLASYSRESFLCYCKINSFSSKRTSKRTIVNGTGSKGLKYGLLCLFSATAPSWLLHDGSTS